MIGWVLTNSSAWIGRSTNALMPRSGMISISFMASPDSHTIATKTVFKDKNQHHNPTNHSNPFMHATTPCIQPKDTPYPGDIASASTHGTFYATKAQNVLTCTNAPPATNATQFMKNATHTASASATTRTTDPPIQTPLTTTLNKGTPNITSSTKSPRLPTPVKVSCLSAYLNNYDPVLKCFLVDGFTHGFDLGDGSDTTTSLPPNSASVNLAPQKITEKLSSEILAGRLAGPFDSPPFSPFHVSPISLRPKKNPGEYRLIHDLSYPYDETSINFNIPPDKRHVKYSSVGEAINKIMQLPVGAYGAKTDIAHAFKLIPIKPELYPKLGIHFDNKYYYDMTLPQGCASSCQIFETFSTAIQWIFEQKEPSALCTHYVDDFVFFAENESLCQQHLECFLDICNSIGVPIAQEKTTKPATRVTFLGIELDTVARVAKLPFEKITENISLINHYLKLSKIRKSELDSLLGKLCFATSVIPARPFLRRLYDIAAMTRVPFHYLKLGQSTKADLKVWLEFLTSYNGITFFRHAHIIPSQEINMLSDASKEGFGATYGTQWVQGHWPASWSRLHITVLEFFPVFIIISLFKNLISNSNILFHSDNMAVVEIINKQTSKNKHVMHILRPLVLTLMKHNINLRARHIPGINNILCDKISRFQVSSTLLRQYGMRPAPTAIPPHLLPENFTMKWKSS